MASLQIQVSVVSVPSTSITLGGSNNGSITLTGPVAPGALIGPLLVAPLGWNGAITLTGADAAFFTVGMLNGVPQLLASGAGLPIRATPYAVEADSAP